MSDELHYPVEFWAPIIRVLDERVWNIAKVHGFGKSGLEIIIRSKKVQDLIYRDEVSVRRKDMQKG